MKKLIVLVMVLGLVMVGCCKKTALDGTTTNSFINCLNSDTVDYVCSGEDGKLTAADMLAVLEFGRSVYAGDSVNIEQAIAVLTISKKTGCFIVAQLKAAFEVVDSVNASTVKAKGPLRAAVTPLPQYEPLRKLVK